MVEIPLQDVRRSGAIPTADQLFWWGAMAWTKPQYSRGKIDKSGAILIAADVSESRKNEAMTVMGNWRSAHSYPLEIALKTLRRKATNVDPKAIVASRLKRFPAIALKLRREPMRLSQMQDIGGCRAVLRGMKQVGDLLGVQRQLWGVSDGFKEINYIETPKETGYRSVHFVWKYQPNSSLKQDYAGMRVEIQIRSALQHAWATAVEMASTFLNEDLKFGLGNPKWSRFFALMGSAIARLEDCPLVPGTPQNKNDLRRQLGKLSDDLGIEGLMKRWSELTTIRDDNPSGDARVFLVTLQPGDYQWQLRIRAFRESETMRASDEYLQAEKDSAEKHNVQVALVSVESIDTLRDAYPNYYRDTSEFLKTLQTVLHGARGGPLVRRVR